jgi:hypothetical protein
MERGMGGVTCPASGQLPSAVSQPSKVDLTYRKVLARGALVFDSMGSSPSTPQGHSHREGKQCRELI